MDHFTLQFFVHFSQTLFFSKKALEGDVTSSFILGILTKFICLILEQSIYCFYKRLEVL